MDRPTAFTELVGCRRAVQLAAMGGVGSVELAVAVARAGGLGMLPSVAAEPLAHRLDATAEALRPGEVVGVGFLVPFLVDADVDLAAARLPVVELFWGTPDRAVVDRAAAHGAVVGWQVGAVDEAVAAVGAGCGYVVAQGVEAGGHVRGTVPLAELLPAVRAAVDVPVVAAGGIGTAADVRAALAAGADAVRIGTRFVAARESAAHPRYLDALLRAGAGDTVLTTTFGEGWPDAPHRVLASSVAATGRHRPGDVVATWRTPVGDLPLPVGSVLPPTADMDGDVDALACYAGTSVGAVTAVDAVATIVAELLDGVDAGG